MDSSCVVDKVFMVCTFMTLALLDLIGLIVLSRQKNLSTVMTSILIRSQLVYLLTIGASLAFLSVA